MEATKFFSPSVTRRPFSPGLSRKSVRTACCKGTSGRDFGGRIVDENMIVLRLRIKEMKMLEDGNDHNPPSDWMEWEKKYYAHYDTDVCEAIGLLQNYLMNVRPCLALGLLVIFGLYLPISAGVVLVHVMEIAKGILSGFR